MSQPRYKTLTEQVADEIRKRIQDGRWTGSLPGREKLAAELGVNHKTCRGAMKLLELEGLLVSEGNGKARMIKDITQVGIRGASLRVSILLYEKSDLDSHFLMELLHRLRDMGHHANFAAKTMLGMGMSLERIVRHVEEVQADAWIVLSGPHHVLQWFAERPFPSFALFGRVGSAKIASIIPDKTKAIDDLVERLVGFGHQRMVMITRADRSAPHRGATASRFMMCLEEHGIASSSYNLPDWGDSPAEMNKMLESLFRYTPPSALILSEVSQFFATMQWLSQVGLSAPKQVSLACMDPSPIFEWCRPEITHIHWSTSPLINRIVGWVNNISIGKDDRRMVKASAKLVLGGTIGPVRNLV